MAKIRITCHPSGPTFEALGFTGTVCETTINNMMQTMGVEPDTPQFEPEYYLRDTQGEGEQG